MLESKGRKVSVRLSEEELDNIQLIGQRSGLDSLSDIVRAALDLYAETHGAPGHVRSVLVHLPAGLHDRCERLVQSGEGLSVEHEVVSALESHLASRTERLVYETKRLEKIEQMGMARNTRSSLDESLQP